ncbi:MAG: cupredoxin domain-containing protein [Actinomycetota bacterium]|nr:cupredoxin domain-containing protein [Actinomycetota bacterium]
MRAEPPARPDLTREVRFKIPLVFAIPLAAFALIAVVTIGIGAILLSVPAEAATTLAILMAANILGACAFLYLRPRVHRSSVVELVIVALYPVVIGIAIAQTGLGETTEAADHAPPANETAPATGGPTSEITAVDLNWDTNTITLAADEANDLTVVNEDAVVHNLSIYPDPDAAAAQENELFKGPDVPGGASGDYTIEGIKAGTYTFICDYHANMIGEAIVE